MLLAPMGFSQQRRLGQALAPTVIQPMRWAGPADSLPERASFRRKTQGTLGQNPPNMATNTVSTPTPVPPDHKSGWRRAPPLPSQEGGRQAGAGCAPQHRPQPCVSAASPCLSGPLVSCSYNTGFRRSAPQFREHLKTTSSSGAVLHCSQGGHDTLKL